MTSPGRVVDYPLGLRSQGPEFKSPSGRSCRDAPASTATERSVWERPGAAERPRGDLSTIDAARPKGATVYRQFKSPSGRSLLASASLRSAVASSLTSGRAPGSLRSRITSFTAHNETLSAFESRTACRELRPTCSTLASLAGNPVRRAPRLAFTCCLSGGRSPWSHPIRRRGARPSTSSRTD